MWTLRKAKRWSSNILAGKLREQSSFANIFTYVLQVEMCLNGELGRGRCCVLLLMEGMQLWPFTLVCSWQSALGKLPKCNNGYTGSLATVCLEKSWQFLACKATIPPEAATKVVHLHFCILPYGVPLCKSYSTAPKTQSWLVLALTCKSTGRVKRSLSLSHVVCIQAIWSTQHATWMPLTGTL